MMELAVRNQAVAPRLVIREIVLQDFKSYGGRRVIGPFHECFSAIIGPNGSGKSNVIDALMFVFGKKAKKIRLSKLSELIHNPQKGNEKPAFARVEVVFEEICDRSFSPLPDLSSTGPHMEVVENSQLVVAREVSQNNLSKYTVNGRASTWTDVTKLFSGKGIDLEHNRFLILQGEVEQIAMMKPMGETNGEEGLLEYLEDLIGSNQYIESITEKSKQFNELSEVRNDHIQRVRQAEKEKDQLEGPRQEAEMYVRSATEMLSAKCLKAMVLRYQEEVKIDAVREEINENAVRLDGINEQVQKLTLEGKEVEVLSVNKKKVLAEAEIVSKEKSNLFSELEKRDTEMNTRKENTDRAIAKEEKVISSETLVIEKLRQDLVELNSKVVPKLEAELEELETTLEQEQEKLDSLFESVHKHTFSSKSKQEKLEVEAGQLKSKLSEVETQRALIVAQKQVLVDKQKSGQEMVARAEHTVAGLEATLGRLKKELTESELSRNKYQGDLDGVKKSLADTNRLYETSLNQVTSVRQKLESARSNLDSVTNGGSSNKWGVSIHAKLQKEAEKGKIKGYIGRLGDLAGIDPKYEIALAVALTGSVDNAVVERTSDAQSVVEFVKANNLGRTTCIILERAEATPSGGQSTPLPRLIDLVTVAEERLKAAFYFAFRNTLVAEDIDSATKVAFGGEDGLKYRVVTLEGHVVEPSGAITGGGNMAQHKSANRRNNRALVDSAEKEVSQLTSEEQTAQINFENVRNEKNELLRAKDRLEEILGNIGNVLRDFPEEVTRTEEKLDMERRALGRLVVPKLSAEEVAQIESFSQKIAQLETLMEPSQKQIIALETEIGELVRKIVEIGNEKTKEQKSVVEEATADLDQKRKELSRCQIDKNKTESRILKSEKLIRESRAELEVLREKLAVLAVERTTMEAEGMELLGEFQHYKQLVEGLTKEVSEIEKSLSGHKSKIIEVRKKHAEILNEIEIMEQKKRDLESKHKELTKQISSIRKEYRALPHELFESEVSSEPATESNTSPTDPLSFDLPNDQLETVSPPELDTTLIRLETKMSKLHPNLKAIEDYRVKLREYKQKVKEMDALCAQREEVRRALEFLRQERLTMFMAGYNVISLKVKEMYQMLTLGGDAELELVDTSDPFAKGISFSVRPPKKTWKAITQLSGGEKTLSSLALVFALHYFKPTPLYFLDEIDAALDTRNVAIIANYIKQRATNAQFIIISLRNQMFEIADWLVGIYKTDHVSKSVTLDPAAASEGLAAFRPHQERPFYAPLTDTTQVQSA